MYKLKEITKKNIWNSFIIKSDFEFYSFLQSWEWWEVQKKLKRDIIRYWIYKKESKEWNNSLIWVMQVISIRAKRWSYLFIPHWPLIKWDFFDVLKEIIIDLKNYALDNKFDFIRINSTEKNLIENKNKFKNLGFINAPMHEHAEDTHLLDLSQSVDVLMKNIKKKDRYYINRAVKQWVSIVKWNTEKQIKILTNMHIKHSKKVGYHPFSSDFINYLYDVFWDNINTISTSFEWKTESILMTISFWKTCVYYIATSEIINHKFSPNYLCQWEAIKDAKERGAKLYNFWWVSPDENKKHPLSWVTKFKRKFWGYDYSLLHTQDLPISSKYWFNWIIETMRRKKRWYYYKKPE